MIRALGLLFVLGLVGLFALANWGAFIAPTPLSLGLTTVQAPLGLILLALVVCLCLLFTAWVIALQAGTLAASRRQTRELQAQRALADTAEASRFTGLRTELLARLDRLDLEARTALEQHANAIAAQLGQLEDRLEHDRFLPPPAR